MSKNKKVSAIVPAYNEAERIGFVLKILAATPIISEIIVIDDGSEDGTDKIVKGFSQVRFMKNYRNRGKSYSMDKGVQLAKNDVVFFCDADLKDLTPKIVEQIITPVVEEKVDMYIGIRNNVMQKTIKSIGLNSGERALRKTIWKALPDYYKHRYRIETGLNLFVEKFGRGYDAKIFPYYQTLKEKKWGFIKGTFIRWWMNFDVMMAFLRFHLFDKYRTDLKLRH
jgi:glycosyltransferase involved in cell wall biosynthesis